MMQDQPARNRDLEQTVKALQVLERQSHEASYAQTRDLLVERVLQAYQEEGRSLTIQQARNAVEVVLGPDPTVPPPPPPRRWYHNPATVFWVAVVLVLSIPVARLLARLLGFIVRL